MFYLKKKEIQKRINFLRSEKKVKSLKFIFIQLVSNKKLFQKFNPIFKHIFLKNKKVLTSQFKLRCSLSNRGRSINSSFKMSRLKLKQLLEMGLVPGYKKAVW